VSYESLVFQMGHQFVLSRELPCKSTSVGCCDFHGWLNLITGTVDGTVSSHFVGYYNLFLHFVLKFLEQI